MSCPPPTAQAIRSTIYWSDRDSPKAGLILTVNQGLALIAMKAIFPGEKLLAFNGPLQEWGGTTLNLPNTPPAFLRDHCIQVGEGISRDSGGLARFANHSCDPNCGITDSIWITAMKEIAPGTELNWDYAMSEDNDWKMECSCGSPLCRKVVGGYRFLPPERRQAYEGYISEWLLESPRPYVGPLV
jgi:hypothetical protein